MKRSYVILWLIGIFLLCIPMSYLVIIKQHPSAPMKENIILLSICTPLAFAMIGGLCWLAYRFMKKIEMAHVTRNALLIFTGLVFALICVTAPQAAKAIERHNKYVQEQEFHEDFIRGCIESGKKNIVPVFEGDVKNPEKLVETYCNCVYDSIHYDYEANEAMNDPNLSNEAFDNHPKIREIRNKCRGRMMKEALESLRDSL